MRRTKVDNPPNPWATSHVEWLEEPPETETVVYEERARSILSANESPDVPFTYSLNPYRGCHHACAYCYARVSHQYWDFGAGTDFERKLVAKVNAPELLRKRLNRPDWQGATIAFSGNTDCYQPLEATYELTRRCLEVCLAFRNPVGAITKGALIQRDLDLWGELAERARATVHVSVPFADPRTSRAIEPTASSPARRFETIAALARAGVTTGVAVAPVIPGLNDDQIGEILRRASQAGAEKAFMMLVRLPGEVAEVFEARLRCAFPERADKVLNAIRRMRGGATHDGRFHHRMRGDDERWRSVESLFRVQAQRFGLLAASGRMHEPEPPTTFRRPGEQLTLLAEPE